MVLDSQSHLHRQMRILSRIEKRRRYRAWAQAFQLSMLFFFADQIVRTYVAGQVGEGEQRSIFGQSVVQLAHLPKQGALDWVAKLLKASGENLPLYLGLGLWLAVAGMLLLRLKHARFGELLSFGLILSGGFANLVSRHFTTHTFDTFILTIGTRYFSFNIADLCVLVGSFFVFRGYLLRLRHGWMKLSHSSH